MHSSDFNVLLADSERNDVAVACHFHPMALLITHAHLVLFVYTRICALVQPPKHAFSKMADLFLFSSLHLPLD